MAFSVTDMDVPSQGASGLGEHYSNSWIRKDGKWRVGRVVWEGKRTSLTQLDETTYNSASNSTDIAKGTG